MDLDSNPTISQAHPETMDFLSRAWCSFAVQAFQPEMQDQALILHESSIKNSIIDNKPPLPMEKSMKMDDTDKSIPPWKSNDVKSWIWMQQAMHPELNYNSYFQKKWMPWKIGPLKNVSIKKWIKEIKQRRKEEKRLQKAEVHAAISVAGVAAALAAIAAENMNRDESGGTKESAVASAAALVAAQCAKVAEAMGAKRDQLTGVIGSAMSGTNASDILTLTAAATTSLRGAETLKARAGFKNIINGSTPVLPIDSNDYNFNYEKCISILSKGAELYIEKSDGRSKLRSVSIILNGEAKVILRTTKATMLKAFSRQKESVVLDLHVELYKDSNGAETDSCYLIVLTTNRGIIKLDMMDDHQRYRMWSMAINQMLTLSTSFPKYELQFYKS
ncbi:VAN3-binding protein-like isoform X2 [Nicotiana tabacum]|uniref:VAN3-binding protein-like isoform X2 n=1 Tax=Nicotiana tabacum TaxID=4097 RepID=A0A1S4AX68_TOBAC|nr:PREDICTED: VAN3-binding protein-like isoform X2 [Nicotiana tabacum]